MASTSGIRLAENIRRAVKHSGYSISELGREGIEQAIIDDLVSVCWICGGGIHCKERRVTLNRPNFTDKYVRGRLTDNLRSMARDDYIEYFRFVEQKDKLGGVDSDTYFEDVGRRLNLPEYQHVDFCSSCANYLDQIREQNIAPTDIPAPYYFRERSDADIDPHRIVHSYVAEAIGVHYADYCSHQRAIFNPDGVSREDRQHALFWWAARARNERIIPAVPYPWAEIAVRSHGESLLTGKPLEKVYSLALDMAQEQNLPTPPISGHDPLPSDLDSLQFNEGNGFCPACGCDSNGISYCEKCLFSYENCSADGGRLYPKVQSQQITESDVRLSCETCDRSESPPEYYAEALVNKYQPIFDDLERTIPFYDQNTW